MKKTLVALAALAATSAFAAPTITGAYAFGYEATTSTAGSDAAGFGIDTSTVTFADSEDLGGGMKASASINIDTISRASIGGGDTSLSLAGGFGSLSMSQAKGADYLGGLDGKVNGSRTVNDSVGYTLPAFGPVTVGFSHTESAVKTDATGAVVEAGGNGLGVGGAGDAVNTRQRSNTVSLSYAAGGLSANLGYTAYDSQGTSGSKSRVRAKAAYDFGSFSLNGGVVAVSKVVGTYTETLLGGSFKATPALTLGGFYNTSKRDGLSTDATGPVLAADATGNISNTGYKLTAQYDLSKRTSVQFGYSSWEQGGGKRASDTTLLLGLSF